MALPAARPLAKVPGVKTPRIRYNAHCIFCGYDAEPDRPDPERCPRCRGSLFLELDVEGPPSAAARPRSVRVMVGARRRSDGRPTAA